MWVSVIANRCNTQGDGGGLDGALAIIDGRIPPGEMFPRTPAKSSAPWCYNIGDSDSGAYDEIHCDEGRYFVGASGIDYVAPDCETVERY